MEDLLCLKERLTNPYHPITAVQDREFPPKQLRNYNNYLTAVLDAKNIWMYNFKFKDGATSQITTDREHEEVRLTPADKPVKRIVIWYHYND